MGMFAETAIVEYHESFADQGKQTYLYIIHFRFLYIYIYPELNIYISNYVYIYTVYLYIFIYICCCFKRKTEVQAIFLNPFTMCSSCKWKFVICPFANEEKNRSYPFASRLNGLPHLAMANPQYFSIESFRFSAFVRKNI